ncbi:MAG: AAA family ATPase [Smithella sp.]|nr:AAA family ATPase [Smithella sp.]
MEKVGIYILGEKVHETRNSSVYRGHKENGSESLTIKLLNTSQATPSEIAQFRQEYELIKNLDIKRFIKTIDIINYKGGFALILEDFQGIPINKHFRYDEKVNIKSFLKASADIAEALGNLHAQGVIHRNIKPKSILIKPDTEEMKITDFGISAILTHENDEVYNPDFIQETLIYMSPEQTGRMNRFVDYRTDLYSLGITLYEILTGLLPFKSQDPMELIHAHIAMMPKAPVKLNSDIPVIISDILMRLLAKNPEARYQNGFGLEADFRECLKLLEKKKKIETFELGSKDISNRFIVPQKLFGREKERSELISRFEEVANSEKGLSVMVVAGAPGIGKSAMINEIHKPIVAKRGYFISGKYEQFRRDKPYSAFIQAFQVLVKQILSESEQRISLWKKNLLNALGDNGRVITDVIPEVELIVGQQSDLPVLGPEETRNRFKFVFEKFMSVFPQKEHPVALFLDDLQWADMASLQLMKNIMISDIHHLFIIFSYRDNEVDDTHPVSELLREVEKNNIRMNKITLGPLKEKEVTELIVNFLRCSEERGFGLAGLVQEKAGGNPFFVNQFLHTLYNEKMIVHKGAQGWQWDVGEISRMKVADNLIQMMAGKIEKLPANTQDVLKICACIGNRFDLEILAAVRKTSVDGALADLTEALKEGMVNRSGDFYVFHHDRIHEAAYSLVMDAEKSALHYKIGKILLENTDKKELPAKLFYIVDQLNLGARMIQIAAERESLAWLNLEAGKKAKASAAYAPAFNYLKSGIDLLEDNPWTNQYDLTLELYTESTEAAYLMGDFDKMNELAEIALKYARTTMEKVKIFTSRIYACIAREDYQGAIDMALPVVKLLGVSIPKQPNKIHVGIELMKLKIRLLGKKPESLLDFPQSNDPEMIALGKILASMGHAAFYTDPNLLAFIILKAFGLMFKYNHLVPENAFAFTGFGIVLAAGLFDFKGAIEFGKLGLKLVEKLGTRDQEAKTIFVYNALVRHWKYPMKESIEPMLEGYRIGLETGDLGFATFNLFFTEVHYIFTGMELSELEKYMERNNKGIAGLKQGHTLTLQSLTWQAVLNLLGRCDNPVELTGKATDGESLLPSWEQAGNRAALSVYWFVKLILYSLFSEYRLALKASDEFRKYVDAQQGVLINKYAVVLDSVARLMTYKDASFFNKIKHRVLIGINQLKMWAWARSAPMNCSYMYNSMRALYAWIIHENLDEAEKCFELAIKQCKEYDDFVVEGISSEIIAGIYRSIGDEKKSKHYMAETHACYSKWGATGLLNKIRKMYPDLVPSETGDSQEVETTTTAGTKGDLSVALDLSTVMQVSQVISSEIMLERLLQNIMHMSITGAGAQRGYLMLESEGKLLIEASEDIDNDETKVMQSIPLQECTDICQAIINYVHHSGKDVILGNAAQEGPFADDSYVIHHQCKSILCIPIINKGKISGILYMENNLSQDAFTPQRLDILRFISALAAISIENAKLFELAATLENIEDGYWEIDLTGNYTFFNNAVCQIHGYSKEELMGMNNRQYTDPETARKVYKAFNNVYKTGTPLKGLNWQIVRKDGTRRYVEISILLQKDSSGKPIGFRGVVRDITERKQMEEKLQQTLDSLSKAYDSTLQVMVSAVEVRDPYTALHQVRSADVARDIAIEMCLPQEKIDAIRMAGAIHDIGKLSIPPEILTKPDKLTGVEFALIKEHSRSGYEILKNVESPWPLAQIVHQHHERIDGSGYPRSLKGDEISLEARVLAVADVVSAMISHRYHRPSLGIEAALGEIEQHKGVLYDQVVVDACLKLFREKGYKLT